MKDCDPNGTPASAALHKYGRERFARVVNPDIAGLPMGHTVKLDPSVSRRRLAGKRLKGSRLRSRIYRSSP